ncbi:MAG TPA: prepilin-type N-terminal cleavage/methylation domain-containing protein [Terriglobia bacterium]|nr:prepilin-type N-terminal cleavage/methylation domain-containing protein [Terriglobia bacterium]
MSQLHSKSAKGFTLIEVLVASFVLCVGLLSAAFLVGKMMTGSVRSKDMSTAAVLTSEKLEDLNRWDNDDPHICLPSGSTTVGSLTSDINQTTTCAGGGSASINYFDDVYPSVTNGTSVCSSVSSGCFAETVSSVAGTSTTYTTTVHSPNGIVQASSSTSPPTGRTFHRRWVIEGNTPATGVRRITVLVTESTERPPLTFQMSIVRN